jgi:thiosulfate/3-mercaptopyruvate sulfurtransferase
MLQDLNWGRRSFDEAHIIGSAYADLNKHLSSSVGPKTGRHPLPQEKEFISFIRSLGISNNSHVVVYDDASGSMAAARLWWLLRMYGLETVQVLNGSFSDWKTAGLPVESSENNFPAGSFQGGLDQTMIVDAATVDQARRDSAHLLIDARSHDRFIGENETIDTVSGHIPGAVNRPLLDNLGADKKLKPAHILAADFKALIGNRKIDDAILYCGSGVTACYNLLAMEVAGLHGAKIYPGSWSEWITNPSHEIATNE